MTDFSKGTAFVDGQNVAIADAKISLLDWGFLHSDATYDVAHVWQGKFFRINDHIDRFHASMANLRMSIPYDRDQVRSIMLGLVRLSELRDAYVEIICTRGTPEPGSRDPRSCENKFFAFAIPFIWIATTEQRDRGLNLLISQQQRIASESIDPRIKNYHWLDMVKAMFEAYDQEADTAVVVDRRGNLVEGPGFNIFACQGDTVITPAAGILEGVTRRTVLELLAQQTYKVQHTFLNAEAAKNADEVFITSTAGGIIPVTRINGVNVADGTPGPISLELRDAYWALHEQPNYTLEVDYQGMGDE
jgi:branched-chain amino acid aminotransferase